ncbi:MAG: hypothetical protein CVU57_30690 [Deltaproteobacteria bacterium HGW-Deltaproteobacteria-15]|nr:MAG: hypothetical protein CVU57_30690 [Deltaproteobacteria bacterium HGW-Deltaproteobacteria-15]
MEVRNPMRAIVPKEGSLPRTKRLPALLRDDLPCRDLSGILSRASRGSRGDNFLRHETGITGTEED